LDKDWLYNFDNDGG